MRINKKMKINSKQKVNLLHLSVSALCDKFYKTLLNELSSKGIGRQLLFVPYSKSENMNRNIENLEKDYSSIDNVSTLFSPVKKKYHKLLFSKKISAYYKELEDKVEMSNVEIIHAHHLFSDGAVAYKVYQNHDIPYVISVRTTDIEFFYKYFRHLHSLANDILHRATSIICINPNIKNKLVGLLKNNKFKKQIINKIMILPNGVDSYWINNMDHRVKNVKKPIKLLQVGTLTRRKNARTTIKALSKLNRLGKEATLDIIGAGPRLKKLQLLSKKYNVEKKVKFHGYVTDRNELLSIYRNSDIFILPSISETFGISYLEAMSQGLPLIYTENQGIDGFFEEGTLGFSVNPKKEEQIASSALKIIANYQNISKNSLTATENFKWENILKSYIKVYKINC